MIDFIIIQASRLLVIIGIIAMMYFDHNELDLRLQERVGVFWRKVFILCVFAYLIITIWQAVGIDYPAAVKVIKYLSVATVILILRQATRNKPGTDV